MSDESKHDDLRLPDELAAFEASLAAKPLPAPTIDRDQLMYCAGWAACEAQCQPRPLAGGRHALPEKVTVTREYPRAEPGATDVRRTLAWSCASAALAVGVTLGLMRGEMGGSVGTERAGGGTPRLAGEGPATAGAANDQYAAIPTAPASMSDVERLLSADARGGRATLAGPWLTLHRADQRSADARTDDALTEVDATPAAPKTIRDLQQELLPLAPAPRRLVWPWERTTSGDSI